MIEISKQVTAPHLTELQTSEFRTLVLTKNGEHTVVNFHWPVPIGSISDQLLADLDKLMDHLEDCSTSTVVVFPGLAGEFDQGSVTPDIDHCRLWEKTVARIANLPAVTVAAIDGVCVRFCVQLMLACDYRLATEDTTFVSPEIKEGYLPGMATFRLAKFVGIGIARRILFTGLPFKAK